jgi:hypothetical protein
MTKSGRKKKTPKRVLALPELEQAKSEAFQQVHNQRCSIKRQRRGARLRQKNLRSFKSLNVSTSTFQNGPMGVSW